LGPPWGASGPGPSKTSKKPLFSTSLLTIFWQILLLVW
jgi:hypothetical protein